MRWYLGGIAEAITFSKSRGSVFVVYIEGTDEISQKITDLIDNGELGHKLEQDCFVAVKLKGGSVEHQQFSEIYKEPTIPSIYLIGKNGVPLDIITGKDNLDNVCQKIDNTLSKAGVNIPQISGVSASVSSDNFIKNELDADNPKVVCDNEVCKIVDKSPEDDSSKTEISEVLPKKDNANNDEMLKENIEENREEKNIESQPDKLVEEKKENEKKDETPNDSPSADEKIQRAKELLELRRQQKEQEEKENERQKELERRKMGMNVQQLKKWQEDQEMKQLKEEREREKRENQQARERVLAQIAQDRAERLSRSQSNSPPSAPESSKSTSQSPPKVSSNKTRLQFKLPDGSSSTHEFENSDTLDLVISYIRSNLPLPFSNFTLSTMFPRREFTKNDFSQTLVDLQLSPSAVILILPQSSGPVTNNPGGSLTALIYTLLSPIFSLFDFLKGLVFGANSNGRPQKRPPPDEPMESQRFSNSKRKATDPSTVVRRQGNIHRLSDTNDSDDENNTWNGNSTQQM